MKNKESQTWETIGRALGLADILKTAVARCAHRDPEQSARIVAETLRGVIVAALEIAETLEDDEDDSETEALAVSLAGEKYGSDDIEIDEDTRVSIGDDGAFVRAWVFVSNQEMGK